MIITNLNINAFGKFIGKSISFSNGLNVIYGNNEAGKSTTHAFIKAMLFGLKKKKSKVLSNDYSKYSPWDSKNQYSGSLSFIYKDNEYQIYREFNDKNPIFEIRNVNKKGELINNPELFLNNVLNNLNINSFDNTISIAQLKTAQDGKIVNEFRRIISNLNTSGDMSIDTLYAINYLDKQREDLTSLLDNNAVINYNRNLGNIRNIERELSTKKYENKLPATISLKANESNKIIENNKEIENLKQSIIENSKLLESYGLVETKDIDTLSTTTSKIFLEYKPMLKSKNRIINSFINIVLLITGIIMITISFTLLVATYPDIASILNLSDTRYTMIATTNFLIHLPFHPIILISILICIGLILIIGNVIMIIDSIKKASSSKELKNILSDIFNQQINDDEINDLNMMNFKKHIKEMRMAAKEINDFETRIITLTNENNSLLKKQTEYDDIIKSQQRIQFEVDQKYKDLYSLKNENDKLKNTLLNNDRVNMEIDSINLAIETIKNLSDEIQVEFGTHLNKAASNYIEILTNGKYKSLNIDNSLNVTINYNDKVIPISDTSTGTIDQLYLALRLAMIDFINNKNNALPLLFDDCFVMYDNERLSSTLNFLNKHISSQILIFTCHKREKEILEGNNINANFLTI